MSEYVVRWKHWRCVSTLDYYVGMLHDHSVSVAYASPRKMESWYCKPGYNGRVSQYGGKTECAIFLTLASLDPMKTTFGEPVARAEAICSWRDQFDRRVGRLYSLALALCELPEDYEVRLDILKHHFPLLCPSEDQVYSLVQSWEHADGLTVKRICAEIVASWKATHKTMKRTETNAGIRSLSSCVQGGDSDVMPCGHPRSAMVRGEYWGKDAEGRDNYTWYCGACSDDAQEKLRQRLADAERLLRLVDEAEAQQQGEEAQTDGQAA